MCGGVVLSLGSVATMLERLDQAMAGTHAAASVSPDAGRQAAMLRSYVLDGGRAPTRVDAQAPPAESPPRLEELLRDANAGPTEAKNPKLRAAPRVLPPDADTQG